MYDKVERSKASHVLSDYSYLISVVMSENICMFYQVNGMHRIIEANNVSDIFIPTNLDPVHQSQNFIIKDI
jgi:hypothetical protein